MMGWFGVKAVEKGIDLVDKVVGVIDKTGLSEQEAQDSHLQLVTQTIEEGSERSKARRYIAEKTIDFFFWYVGINVAFYICAAFVGPLEGGTANSFMVAGNMMKDLASVYMIGAIAMTVFIFFFGNHGVRAWRSK